MKEIRIKGIRIRDYHLRKFLKETKSTKEQLIKWLNEIESEHFTTPFPCVHCLYKGKYTLYRNVEMVKEESKGSEIVIDFDIYDVWDVIRLDKKQFNKLINFIKNYE